MEVRTIQTFEIITGGKKKTNPKITKKSVQVILIILLLNRKQKEVF